MTHRSVLCVHDWQDKDEYDEPEGEEDDGEQQQLPECSHAQALMKAPRKDSLDKHSLRGLIPASRTRAAT